MGIQALQLVTCFLWAIRFLVVVLGALYAQFGKELRSHSAIWMGALTYTQGATEGGRQKDSDHSSPLWSLLVFLAVFELQCGLRHRKPNVASTDDLLSNAPDKVLLRTHLRHRDKI